MKPKTISACAAMLPRHASKNSSLPSAMPSVAPSIPSTTDPATWPMPHRKVIHRVLTSGHPRALRVAVPSGYSRGQLLRGEQTNLKTKCVLADSHLSLRIKKSGKPYGKCDVNSWGGLGQGPSHLGTSFNHGLYCDSACWQRESGRLGQTRAGSTPEAASHCKSIQP